MSILKAIYNIKKFIRIADILKRLILKMTKGFQMPQCSETQELFDAVEDLLDSGAIDIPGVDEAQLSTALKEIEARWTCKV